MVKNRILLMFHQKNPTRVRDMICMWHCYMLPCFLPFPEALLESRRGDGEQRGSLGRPAVSQVDPNDTDAMVSPSQLPNIRQPGVTIKISKATTAETKVSVGVSFL